jgi:hypothetical protein
MTMTAYYGEDGRLYYQSSHPLIDGQPVGDIRPQDLVILNPPSTVPLWITIPFELVKLGVICAVAWGLWKLFYQPMFQIVAEQLHAPPSFELLFLPILILLSIPLCLIVLISLVADTGHPKAPAPLTCQRRIPCAACARPRRR